MLSAIFPKPQVRMDSQTQTQTKPMIAIERPHLDSIHGPYIVSPLDLAVPDVEMATPKSHIEVERVKTTRDQPTQTDFDQVKTQAKAVQTDFTSFTGPTHYNYTYLDRSFDRFLVLDASEKLPSNVVEQQAKEFNQEVLGRYGALFPLKFIARYFCYNFPTSRL